MSYQALASEIMYRTTIALTPPNTSYMNEVTKGLSTTDYLKNDYLSRIQDLFKKEDPVKRNPYNRNSIESKETKYNFGKAILYRAASNPGKN